MDKPELAQRLLAVVTRMVTFNRADDYRAAKFGMEQATKTAMNAQGVDLAADPEQIMRSVFSVALAESSLMPVSRKTKAIDLASKAKAREILLDAFREELPDQEEL